jgi:ribosomal protein L24
MIIGDRVKIVRGQYKGDEGRIVKFLEVRVKVKLVCAAKVANLNRSSLSSIPLAANEVRLNEHRAVGVNIIDTEESNNDSSVAYLINKINQMRLTQLEKLELLNVLKEDIKQSIDNDN